MQAYSNATWGLAFPVEAATEIYNDVDAGEYRQVGMEIREFDQASGAVDYLILVGLHESDRSDSLDSTAAGLPSAQLYGDGTRVKEGVGPDGGLFKTHPSSREQLVSRAKLAMLNQIVKGSSGDELLGLGELRITQTDMEKLKQLNGAPIMKQLVFKGDDSLYAVDFRFRMEK